MVSLFAKLIGTGLGVSDRAVDAMLDNYRYELFQAFYDPEFVQALAAKLEKQAKAKQRERQGKEDLLKKVDTLTSK
jgi:hypothetical protein